MKCPNCGADTKAPVDETRNHDGSVYRARRCQSCDTKFVTVERVHAAGMPQRIRSRQMARLEEWQRQHQQRQHKPARPKPTGIDYMAAWRK